LLAVWNAGEFSPNLLLSNAPWLFGSGKPGRPCERMQRALSVPENSGADPEVSRRSLAAVLDSFVHEFERYPVVAVFGVQAAA
jgi:hypothetical protein